MVLALILTVGVAYAQDYNKDHAHFKVDLNFAKNPPTVGTNDFVINVRDSIGKPITSADIAVNYFIKGQKSAAKECKIIPPHGAESMAELEKTAYKSKIDFCSPGLWTMVVEIKFEGITEVAQYDIRVE